MCYIDDMKELLPLDECTSLGAVEKWRREAAQRCDPIDARIKALESEYYALTDEYNAIKDLPVPKGFFASLRARRVVKDLVNRMDTNHELLARLIRKRIANS